MPTKLLWKLPGVILAAISLVMLMTPALGIQFKPWFVEFLKELEDWEVTLFFQFITPHVVAAIDCLNATFGWHLKLADWWHHSFVLLWLLFGTVARNVWSDGSVWSFFLFVLLWGGLSALVAGAMTGTVPLNSAAMFMWPGASFALFMAADAAWDATRGRRSWWTPLGYAALASYFAYKGYADTKPLTALFGFSVNVPSPGLLVMACFVGAAGLGFFLLGLFAAAREGDRIDNPGTGMGFDILGAFGFAAAFAIAGLYL